MNHQTINPTGNNRDFKIVSTVRHRRLFLLAVRGIAICLVVAAVLLLGTGYAAHSYRNQNAVLILLRLGALFGLLASVFFFLVQRRHTNRFSGSYPVWRQRTAPAYR